MLDQPFAVVWIANDGLDSALCKSVLQHLRFPRCLFVSKRNEHSTKTETETRVVDNADRDRLGDRDTDRGVGDADPQIIMVR